MTIDTVGSSGASSDAGRVRSAPPVGSRRRRARSSRGCGAGAKISSIPKSRMSDARDLLVQLRGFREDGTDRRTARTVRSPSAGAAAELIARLRSSAGSWRPKSSSAIRWAIEPRVDVDRFRRPRRRQLRCRCRTAEAPQKTERDCHRKYALEGCLLRSSCRSSPARCARGAGAAAAHDHRGRDVRLPVIGHRLRRQDDAPAEQVQPPPEIHVLEAGNEILVKASGLQERRAGEERRSGARKQQRLLGVGTRRRLASSRAARMADERRRSRRRNRPSLPSSPGSSRRRRPHGDARPQRPARRATAGSTRVSLFSSGDEFAVGRPDRRVVRGAAPAARLEPEHADARIPLSNEPKSRRSNRCRPARSRSGLSDRSALRGSKDRHPDSRVRSSSTLARTRLAGWRSPEKGAGPETQGIRGHNHRGILGEKLCRTRPDVSLCD